MSKRQQRLFIADLEIIYKAGVSSVAVGVHPDSAALCPAEMRSGFIFTRQDLHHRKFACSRAREDYEATQIEAQVRAAVKERWARYYPRLKRSHTRIETAANHAKETEDKNTEC